MFAGFPPDALGFLSELAANNERAWFQANKPRYEAAVVAPFRALLEAVILGCAARDIPLSGDPAKALFRIHRDVRFSADKRPYKTHAGAVLARDGGRSPDGGIVYVHVAPEGSFLASGFYAPDAPRLGALREAIFVEPSKFAAIEAELAAQGLSLDDTERLTRLPRGYEAAAGQKVADTLRLKSFIVRRALQPDDLASPDLPGRIVDFAEQALPLLRFGWQALSVLDPTDLKRQK